MSDENAERPKIIVDEDWKSRVEAEREALAQQHKQAQAEGDAADKPAEDASKARELPIPDASFSVLVTTIGTQALVALGQAPAPDEEQVVVNLPFAKHCIDTLGILADKTKGNLTTTEDTLLSRFLHDLRMLYVSVQNQLKKQASADKPA